MMNNILEENILDINKQVIKTTRKCSILTVKLLEGNLRIRGIEFPLAGTSMMFG